MFEWGHVLRAWALDSAPRSGGGSGARALADHRMCYLDYEGPVSKGRGDVAPFDHGTYVLVRESEQAFVAELTGKVLAGQVSLCRNQQHDSEPWRVQFS